MYEIDAGDVVLEEKDWRVLGIRGADHSNAICSHLYARSFVLHLIAEFYFNDVTRVDFLKRNPSHRTSLP